MIHLQIQNTLTRGGKNLTLSCVRYEQDMPLPYYCPSSLVNSLKANRPMLFSSGPTKSTDT